MDRRRVILVFVGWLSACHEDGGISDIPLDRALAEFERAYCQRMAECPCEFGRYFSDRASCEEYMGNRLASPQAAATELGLRYDGRCYAELVAALDDLGCDRTRPEDPTDGCVAPCKPFVGDRGLGDSCRVSENDYTTDDCAAGLRCDRLCNEAGTCLDVCVEHCANTDSACARPCGEDEFCNYDTRACEALPREGQRCPQGVCGRDLFCVAPDPTSDRVCTAPGAEGEPCRGHAFCESGYCPAGRCAPLPGLGESCAGTFTCAPGLTCQAGDGGATTVCVEGDPAICDAGPPI